VERWVNLSGAGKSAAPASARTAALVEFTLPKLLIVPALALIGLFVVFPLVWSVVMSFTNYSMLGVTARKWGFIGLKNYIWVLTDPDFQAAIANSFIFTIVSALIGQALLGLALAVVMRMKGPEGWVGAATKVLKVIAGALVFVAWIIPEVVAGYCWAAAMSRGGLFTAMFGINYNFYVRHPLQAMIIANIWRGTAFSMILFMAALESIPNYIYEAAEVDGATPWQRFRYVTFPLISNALLVDFILITVWTFGLFTLIFTLIGPQMDYMWTLYVYVLATGRMGPPWTGPGPLSTAAAAADIMFVIVLALITGYLYALRRLRRWA